VTEETSSPGAIAIGEYNDDVHAETLDGIEQGEYGYKYRLVDGVMMPPYITPKRYDLSRRIPVRPGDVCYTSYPKSGSTWLAYILVLILNGGEAPSTTTLRNCLHWVASSWTYPRSEEELESMPSPRIFKSHMPYHMAVGGEPTALPAKYVYIARNPKDVAVSYFHFESGKSWAGGYSGPWEHWLKLFSEGRVQRGDWFDHVLGWWAQRSAGNILFLKYEDLCRDFPREIDRLATFLDHPLPASVIDTIQNKTSFTMMQRESFSNMHEIEEFNQFFRQGKIGSWKEQFSPEQSDAFDRLCAQRLEGSGLSFESE
jgi:hypothetical protein